MIQDKNNTNHYTALAGKTFTRKADQFNMGEDIWLGVNDSIDNYESVKIENYDDEA
jgi:hypothetical protein